MQRRRRSRGDWLLGLRLRTGRRHACRASCRHGARIASGWTAASPARCATSPTVGPTSATIRATCCLRPVPSFASASCTTLPGPTPRVSRIASSPGSPAMPGATTITTRCGAAWSGCERCCANALGVDFESRICVDTAPLLERSYARHAGLGWIGKNTCLINQRQRVVVLPGRIAGVASRSPLESVPPPDRCGTCRRCIDACPTAAIVPGRRRTLDGGFAPLHLVLHHRAARARSGRASRRHRARTSSAATSARTCAPGTGARRSPTIRPSSPAISRPTWSTGGNERRGIPRGLPRHSGDARPLLGISAQRGGGHGQCRPREVPQRRSKSWRRRPIRVVAEHARWALGQLP